MRLRREPAIARWLLKVFCSGPEHDSVIGDLMEQYQLGRGRTWYWRQVLALSLHGLYSKIARRPLTPAHRFPVGLIFAAILVSVALVTALLSDIGIIFLAAIVGGICVGLFKFVHGDGWEPAAQRAQHRGHETGFTDAAMSEGVLPEHTVPSNSPRIARIDSSKIPIGGGIGAGIIILILFIAVLHDLPDLRWLAIPGLLAGLVFAAVLRLWKKWHPRDPIGKDWLSIKR